MRSLLRRFRSLPLRHVRPRQSPQPKRFMPPFSPDLLFTAGNLIVFCAWMMVIFVPDRSPRLMFIPKYAVPALFAFVYAGITLAHFYASGGGYGSLAELRTLFATDELLVAGWLHYLAFDLFIGVWIAEQADRISILRMIQAVILIAAFIFPPVGLLLFLATRVFMLGAEKVTQ